MNTKNLLVIGAIIIILVTIVACTVTFLVVGLSTPLEEPVSLLPLVGAIAFMAIPRISFDEIMERVKERESLKLREVWTDTKIFYQVVKKGRRSVTVCDIVLPNGKEFSGAAIQNPCDDFELFTAMRESFRHALEKESDRALRSYLWEVFFDRNQRSQDDDVTGEEECVYFELAY